MHREVYGGVHRGVWRSVQRCIEVCAEGAQSCVAGNDDQSD